MTSRSIHPVIPPGAAVLIILLLITVCQPVLRARAQSGPASCQCTDYAYRQRSDLPGQMGHARDWVKTASDHALPVDHTPQIGDVAVILNGEHGFNREFGHVAIVIGVNRDHTLFDIAGYDGIRNNCMVEIYTRLPVTANIFFIHRALSIYR